MKKTIMLFVIPFICASFLILSIYMNQINNYYKNKYSYQIDNYYKGYVGEEPPKNINVDEKLFKLTSKAYFKGKTDKFRNINNND